ncbi:MAG TPA: vanadium-dependent haloperoxidase [Thermoanaerobaculia bacterium]|nr:vanadium-dependent haloperoxidase [Thermoanaerobaculia bacterium]
MNRRSAGSRLAPLPLALALLAAAAPALATRSPDAASALAWNARILELAVAEDGLLTLRGVRTAALAHLAMHDALQAIDPRYATSACARSEPGADPLAAATAAAHAIVASQFPGHAEALGGERDRWLATLPDGEAKALGVELGRACAEELVARRADDGWDTEAGYQFHPMGPGVYAEFAEHSGTPQGFVFGTGWARAKPLLLERADQLRVPPPPAIGTEAYRRAFDEVKEVGRTVSATRTADQTHLAFGWKEFVESSVNRFARELVAEEGLDLWDATRLLALVNAAIYDGYVSVFENKFHYNHWRPYTAIRWAAHDGDPATEPEPEWDNAHRHTYAFPTYPSAHGTVCAAAFGVLAHRFGDEREFTMTNPEVDSAGPFSPKMKTDPPTRSFASFSEAALECGLSRVYLGIHFRYDSVEGVRLGHRIADLAWEGFLRPLEAPQTAELGTSGR